MRRVLLLSIVLLLSAFAGHAQSPPGINYQGVARNPDGKPLALRDIAIRINILKDGGNGEVEYSEIHSVKTNSFGLFTLVIGAGSVEAGDFRFISWAVGSKWLRVEMDPDGGSSFQLMGAQQFMSVPYAFYAKYSDNNLTAGEGISIANNTVTNTGDADKDPANEYNTSIIYTAEKKLRITDGGGTIEADLSSLAHGDIVQDLRLNGNKLSVDNNPIATEIDLAPYLDNTDAQQLRLEGNDLFIDNGNSVSLAPYLDDTDKQQLTYTGTTLSIERGNSIDLSNLAVDTDKQNLALAGNTLSIDRGNSIDLSPFAVDTDTDAQSLSFSGNTLSIDRGNSVDLSSLAVDTDTDKQNITLTGTTLSIDRGNSVNLAAINAPQNLSFVGTNLAISGGNTVDLASLDTDQQNLTFSGNNLSISGGNSVNLGSLATDAQTLNLSLTTLSIAGGNSVSLAPFLDNTDNQDLTLTGNTLSLTNDGTTVNLAPYLDNTDNQNLSLAGNILSLTNDASTVNLAPYLDNTDDQDLALTGNTLSLTNDATPIDLAPYLDNTDNQNLSVSAAGTNRMISISGGTGVTVNVADNDNDPANEIQTLTYTGGTKTLSIAGGNSVVIPETQNLSQVLTQSNDAGGTKITNLGAPTINGDASTKLYVDTGDNAIIDRLNKNYAFKTTFAYATLLTGASNVTMPLSGESFDDFNVVGPTNFTAQAAGFYIFTIDGSITSLLVGSSLSLLYNGTKYPVSVGSNNRFNTTLMFRLSVGETVSLVADGIGINTNINGSFFGYKLP